MSNRARNLIFLGGILVTGSWIALFLIVLGIFSGPFVLNLALYATSTSGMFLGFLGAATYVKQKRGSKDQDEKDF
ncbi:MAG: hypothetical protein V5A79_03850 [Candidatus Bipolaricaulota bacterium]